MLHRDNFMYCFATVDVDAVWQAREAMQAARNKYNQLKNEPNRYDGIRNTLPELQR